MSAGEPTVYAVDDEPATLKAIARLLRAAGWSVAASASPREFREKLDPAAPGCLVLDLSMPEMTGLEVQQALDERRCALPIVFLTGRADVPTSVKAMKRGAADFLTNPWTRKTSSPPFAAPSRRTPPRARTARRSRRSRSVSQASRRASATSSLASSPEN